ncbi:FGGY-family carbohydrate kinase [Rhodobacteraceae bacterium M385]|nr:FGGY-family carbohydrate kinase [Rhodobacteraceae bacterium M385]
MSLLIGIDVGTGSARAGVFTSDGTLLASHERPIQMWRPRPDWAQQSSADIWSAVCGSVRAAIATAGAAASDVAGIGFDATCSLVVSGEGGQPVAVGPEDDADANQDVIVWMDHRATGDAEEINRIGGAPLAHVGGVISPEMQLPKLRWLQREKPESWNSATRFWDLPDWLTHRATGAEARSLCSAVCKWTYMGHLGAEGEGWDDAFLHAVGLSDLTGSGHERIGTQFKTPGSLAGHLTERAAAEMGLAPGTPVATSLIDAHAGAIGTLGAGEAETGGRLAVIAGTSTCHIALADEAAFVPGVWGPYYGAVTEGKWCLEGGQSAAGALIDAILARHGAVADLRKEAQGSGESLFDRLDAELDLMAAGSEMAELTAYRHIQPDIHGNRSPLADPRRRAGIDGLTLETGPTDAALDYLATLQALGYGTRHILETMRTNGVEIDTLVVSGGMARNQLFLRELSDATGCSVLVPDTPEPVLLGSAILGGVAADLFADATSAMRTLAPGAATVRPRASVAEYHSRKYNVFRRMQDDHAAYERIMTLNGEA